MAPELDLLTFPIPGLVGAMAQMFEGAGWDGLYLAIAAVQAASGGRAVLGIGRGDSSLGYLGRRPAPVADFEIYLARVRGFLHGETVDLGGATSHNQWITEIAQPPVPIDVEVARAIARGGTASFAHFSGMPGAPRTDGPDAAVFEAVGRDYDMAGHATAGVPHAAALPDEFIDRFAVAGPSEHCVTRLSELVEAGAERLVLVPGSRDADQGELVASMGRLATEVLPRLR